jgi:hypothetical protein
MASKNLNVIDDIKPRKRVIHIIHRTLIHNAKKY